MYFFIRSTIEVLLNETNSQWFNKVFHYVIRLEYQGRGTIHFHIALWCMPKFLPSHYVGRTSATVRDRVEKNMQLTSPFHAYLDNLFKCRVDVQWVKGRLNYINGYTTKAHDAMDFSLDSSSTSCEGHDRWLVAYRLLCRRTVCIPEVALWFYEAEPMLRSCRVGKCNAPIPWSDESTSAGNDSERLYEFY